MRRKDREITNLEEIKTILDQGTFLTVAFCDDEGPYSLPLSYGYDEKDGKITFYIHSAKEGRKVDAFKKGVKVSVSVTSFDGYHGSESGDSWTCYFKSFIGFGSAAEITLHKEKAYALNTLMKRVAKREFDFSEKDLSNTAIFAFNIDSYSAKRKVD